MSSHVVTHGRTCSNMFEPIPSGNLWYILTLTHSSTKKHRHATSIGRWHAVAQPPLRGSCFFLPHSHEPSQWPSPQFWSFPREHDCALPESPMKGASTSHHWLTSADFLLGPGCRRMGSDMFWWGQMHLIGFIFQLLWKGFTKLRQHFWICLIVTVWSAWLRPCINNIFPDARDAQRYWKDWCIYIYIYIFKIMQIFWST